MYWFFCWRCKVCPLHCALLRCTLFLQSLCIYCDVTLRAHKASRDDDLGRLLTAGLRSFSLQLHFPPSQLHPSPFIVLHLVTAVSGVSSCSQGRGRQPACVVAILAAKPASGVHNSTVFFASALPPQTVPCFALFSCFASSLPVDGQAVLCPFFPLFHILLLKMSSRKLYLLLF